MIAERRADPLAQPFAMAAPGLEKVQLLKSFGAGGQRAPIAGGGNMSGQGLERLTIQGSTRLPDVHCSYHLPAVERRVSRGQPGGASNGAARQSETLGDPFRLADLTRAKTTLPVTAPRIEARHF